MYLKNSNLYNKNIILRTDYNVPIENGIIQASLSGLDGFFL